MKLLKEGSQSTDCFAEEFHQMLKEFVGIAHNQFQKREKVSYLASFNESDIILILK